MFGSDTSAAQVQPIIGDSPISPTLESYLLLVLTGAAYDLPTSMLQRMMKIRRTPLVVGSLALVCALAIFFISNPFRAETLREALERYEVAFDRGDFDTIAKYTSADELEQLGMTEQQYARALESVRALSPSKVIKFGDLKFEPNPDTGSLFANQRFIGPDGRQSDFGGNAFVTSEGIKVIPTSPSVVFFAIALNVPAAELPNRTLKIGRWVEWLELNRSRLEATGLKGWYYVQSYVVNPTGTGAFVSWDQLIAKWKTNIALIDQNNRSQH